VTSVADIARATAHTHRMLEPGCPVLVMVSGGADSVGLLHVLATGELGEHPLRVLHVNHLLRAEDSDGDESFVSELCREMGVECRVVRYDVAAWAAEEGLNLEDAGRQIRYRFAGEELDAWCAELGVGPDRGRIAVAHTRDDRVETFFMRAIAGSGTGGLNALAPVRERIVRPLVDVDRTQVRSWLSDRGAGWREDASNQDTTRSRALVRAELMPVAERLNPAVRAAIVRTMDLLADDDALLARMADAFAQDFARSELGERVEFDRAWMRTLERTMARRTIRSALLGAFPHASRLESSHVEALVDGLEDDEFARDLPYGLRVVSEYGTMVILRTDAQVPRVAPSLLSLPGSADLGSAGVISATHTTPHDTAGDNRSVVVDAGCIRGELTVDSVREGDRMRPLGMAGSRKLSDMLAGAKIPRRLRAAVPVVRDGDAIVWVAGVQMSEGHKVTVDTERAFRLTWTGMQIDDVRQDVC
jgi:tRNA(Ile)-lysidine synthase